MLFLLLTSFSSSQVKIFCDKGAERKLRDEERRAAKRRMTPSGKRRLDEMYHETFDRFVSLSVLVLIVCIVLDTELVNTIFVNSTNISTNIDSTGNDVYHIPNFFLLIANLIWNRIISRLSFLEHKHRCLYVLLITPDRKPLTGK